MGYLRQIARMYEYKIHTSHAAGRQLRNAAAAADTTVARGAPFTALQPKDRKSLRPLDVAFHTLPPETPPRRPWTSRGDPVSEPPCRRPARCGVHAEPSPFRPALLVSNRLGEGFAVAGQPRQGEVAQTNAYRPLSR